MRNFLIALAALVAFVAPALAQTTIVGPGTSGNQAGGPIIQPGTAVGQSFISPGGTLLSFSATVDFGFGGNATFHIVELNGATLGASIFETQVAMSTGGLMSIGSINATTVSGQSYAAIFTRFGATGPTAETTMYESSSAYGGGGYFTLSDVSAPVGQVVSIGSPDLSFAAEFDTTPEPGAWALMIGGFGAAGFAARRRRAQRIARAA